MLQERHTCEVCRGLRRNCSMLTVAFDRATRMVTMSVRCLQCLPDDADPIPVEDE